MSRTIREAIEATTALVNPRLSEVDWEAVEREARVIPDRLDSPEGVAYRQGFADGRADRPPEPPTHPVLPVAAITGTFLHRAWLKSGRPDPLLDDDAWDGFGLTLQALAQMERLAARPPEPSDLDVERRLVPHGCPYCGGVHYAPAPPPTGGAVSP